MIKFYSTLLLILPVLFFSCATTKNYNPNKKYSAQQLQQDYTLLRNILEKKHPSLYWYTPKDSMDMYFEKYYGYIKDSMTEQQFGWSVITKNNGLSIIGYITEASEGKTFITRGGNKHELIAQGWNHLK